MDKPIRFKAATTAPCSNKTRFTNKSLKQFADGAENIPILNNFDPDKILGHITKAEIKNGCLEIEGEFTDEGKDFIKNGAVPVPGYINYDSYTDENDVLVIKKLKPISMGLTLTPAEKGLRRLDNETGN